MSSEPFWELIAADGEKYSPEGIEETIIDNSEFIEQLMLLNNQNPYTAGLIVPSKDKILSWAKANNKELKSDSLLAEILQLILDDLNLYKTGHSKELFPQRWLPSTAVVLPDSFTEHNKLLNSTMKVVRSKVEDYFKDDIEFLYTPESKKFINNRNITNLKIFLEN